MEKVGEVRALPNLGVPCLDCTGVSYGRRCGNILRNTFNFEWNHSVFQHVALSVSNLYSCCMCLSEASSDMERVLTTHINCTFLLSDSLKNIGIQGTGFFAYFNHMRNKFPYNVSLKF